MDIHDMVNEVADDMLIENFRNWSAFAAPLLFNYRTELMAAGFSEESADYLASEFSEYLFGVAAGPED